MHYKDTESFKDLISEHVIVFYADLCISDEFQYVYYSNITKGTNFAPKGLMGPFVNSYNDNLNSYP